jgi:poly(ADP-ribose) glycohydrolase ARH3
MEDGKDYRRVAATVFPGGSHGNGAAMRVAPVGLLFRDDYNRVWEEARASALPTHVHPLGIEGAQLLAVAVAVASRQQEFDRGSFFAELLSRCVSGEFRQKLTAASAMVSFDEVAALGNGIEALESAPTAITCFAVAPTSFETAVASAVFLGGDTDAIAAMTGAMAGAFLGVNAIPDRLLQVLEDQAKGRTYIIELADRLFSVYESAKTAEV